jgi:sugar lactone lactonase YvrE
MLYICDTGNGRLLRLHTTTGAAGSSPVASFSGDGPDYEVTGATVDVVVAPGGFLTDPSGIAYRNNTIYVSDYATGIIHAFDLSGNRVNWLDTGRGANSLSGITFGPDGKLYFCDLKNDNVTRIDP